MVDLKSFGTTLMSTFLVSSLVHAVEPTSRPADFVLDGRVQEWQAAPTFALGAADQVAGKVEVQNDADFSARIWVAFSDAGLILAGDVVDDHVLFAADEKARLASDHVELWLALPAPVMPPIGFGNQFVYAELEGADPCVNAKDLEGEPLELELEGCRAWISEQKSRRKKLERLFVRQFSLAPLGVVEQYAQAVQDLDPALPLACCATAEVKFTTTPQGYAFEAFLPFEVWPASAQSQLQEFRILADVVDNDAGFERQESFLSSSRQRKFADVSTFNPIPVAKDLIFESSPAFLEATLKDRPYLFFFPARPVTSAWGFKNIHQGYQYQPSAESPALYQLELPGEKLGDFAGLELWNVPADFSEYGGWATRRLTTLRAGAIAGAYETESYCEIGQFTGEEGEPSTRPGTNLLLREAVSGDPCHLAVIACEQTLSRFGAGACGACPMVSVEILGIDARSSRVQPFMALNASSRQGDAAFGLVRQGATGFAVQGFDELYCQASVFTWQEWLTVCRNPPTANDEPEYLDFMFASPRAEPFFQAIYEGEVDKVRQLLAQGQKPDTLDEVGHTALLVAAQLGHAEIVDALLDYGANANFVSHACQLEKGLTPLLIAAARDHVDTVKRLLEGGAKVDLKLEDGRSASDLAYDESIKSMLAAPRRR